MKSTLNMRTFTKLHLADHDLTIKAITTIIVTPKLTVDHNIASGLNSSTILVGFLGVFFIQPL